METRSRRLYIDFRSFFNNVSPVVFEQNTDYPQFSSNEYLRKDKGSVGRGDGWYNLASVIPTLQRYHQDISAFLETPCTATYKLDGSQIGLTINVDSGNMTVSQMWSRNRELDTEEINGTKKFGMAGSLGNSVGIFTTFGTEIARELYSIRQDFTKMTITGEAYRATFETQTAKFPSIHPFSMTIEMADETEIVFLMTPDLHNLFARFATSKVIFNSIIEMNKFLCMETVNHVFPVPIFHIGTIHSCVNACFDPIMKIREHYFEGFMLSPVFNPNFVVKLKTPQQMKGEFSSIKRLAKPNCEPNGNEIILVSPQDCRTYQMLVDIYDAFLTLDTRKDAVVSAAANAAAMALTQTFQSSIPAALTKFCYSDIQKPASFDPVNEMFFTSPLMKADFFKFLGIAKNFIVDEIVKNYKESSGNELEKKEINELGKMVQIHLLKVFLPPV
jgi:hypothetical protein